MSNENKTRRCWDCDFFIQAGTEDNSGKCVGVPPNNAGTLRGETVTSTIDGLESFANIHDATQTSCGGFKRSTIPIPDPPA